MSVHPDHAAFDAAASVVAAEMDLGLHPKYNHAEGCVCAVGLVKEKMGIPSEVPSDSSAFILKVTGRGFANWGPTSSALHMLYGTRAKDNNCDQPTGARRIREYLTERKRELEEVS